MTQLEIEFPGGPTVRLTFGADRKHTVTTQGETVNDRPGLTKCGDAQIIPLRRTA